MRRKDVEISKELEELGRRLETWRSTVQGRRRLPEELWAAAAGVAEREGINPTARALRLDYTKLKRRMEATTSKQVHQKAEQKHRNLRRKRIKGVAKGATAPAAFVELLTESLVGPQECLIEVEGGGGRMRIQMKLAAGEMMNLVRDWREGWNKKE